jgi:N-acetyl-gamma-glutamyl-phosphate reductase
LGGGKQMIAEYEAAGAAASHFMPYGLTFNHKHLPEMAAYAKLATAPLFVPSVGDYAQGMVTFVPLQVGGLAKVPTGAEVHAAIAGHFAGIKDSFVTVAPYEDLAKTPELDPQIYNNTNQMKLHVFANDARAQVLLVAVYDNLGKGASGAAVQNLNLMLGVDPRTSL